MRTDSELLFFLEQTAGHLQRIGYRKMLSYEFSDSWKMDENGDPDYGRPGYVLFLFYGKELFLTVSYDLDARFRDRIDPREVERVEKLLCHRAMGVIGANGVATLLRSKQKTGRVPYSYILESKDKQFLCLN